MGNRSIDEFKDKIIQGDTLRVLRQIPDNSIDTVITSPPYWGLRDYGEMTHKVWGGNPNCNHDFEIEHIEREPSKTGVISEKAKIGQGYRNYKSGFCKKCGAWYGQLGLEPTLEMFIDHLLEITAELKRVLKPTGVMWWNHGDCYGGSNSGKNDYRNNNKRSISNPNLYAEKPAPQSRLTPKCLALQNYRLILRMIDEQGWILRNVIIWHKPNHMPSSVKDRFTSAYEPVFMLVKNKKYWFDLDAVRVPHKNPNMVRKINKETNLGTMGEAGLPPHMNSVLRDRKALYNHPLGKNPGDMWSIPTQPFPNAHFATFPEKLVEPMIKASCPQWICKKCGKARERIVETIGKERVSWGVDKKARVLGEPGKPAMRNVNVTVGWTDCGCREYYCCNCKKFINLETLPKEFQSKIICPFCGSTQITLKHPGWDSGIVLDPFAGSGTTCYVASLLGRHYIGIEINPKYVEMARKRVKDYFSLLEL